MKISDITITGFKAIQEISFAPGNINVFIGANGAGKSTILEAIGLLSLAMTDRVDNIGLARKGIRLSTPSLYKSSFKNCKLKKTIDLSVNWDDDNQYRYDVHLYTPTESDSWRYQSEILYKNDNRLWGRSGRSSDAYDNEVGMLMLQSDENLNLLRPTIEMFKDYAIYQPVTPVLRGTIPDSTQKSPLGINGGRLAEAIEDLLHENDDGDLMFGSMLIDDLLELIDWADGFSIAAPKKNNINASVSTSRRVIEFCDKFMRSNCRFTAYDASEGSLFVLFLLCLAMHPKAPNIFAIDNFDQAMNPRLAKTVTRSFCDLILDQNKTVFLTTHNPLVLDGLNLEDQRIRLFTTERNRKHGYMKLNRIQVTEDLLQAQMPLSRLWVNGLLGGVPNLL